MKLFEFEGKKLFKKVGIKIPASFLVSNESQLGKIPKNFNPAVVKAQLLSGNRAKRGGIIFCKANSEIQKAAKSQLGKAIDGEEVKKVLIEKYIDVEKEYFFSILFDTSVRLPVILASRKGGTEVAGYEQKLIIDPLNPDEVNLSQFLEKGSFSEEEIEELSRVVQKLVRLFFEYDCRIVEVNPLVKVNSDFIALDAKVILDDAALIRHPELKFQPRSASGKTPSKAEILAKRIDENDHRGVAGSVYFDLGGDIAVLASGGGGSLVALDGILSAGGKPANYTEYSGNPPAEKVYKLAKIVLSKKGLNGLLVAGAVANFTDIFETLSGFLEALREQKPKPKYPIVIRRAGPRDKEAFDMSKKVAAKEGFDFHLFGEETPIDYAARLIVNLAQKYKEKH